MIVYADVLVAVNFFITYFLLLTSAIMSGYTYNRKRIIISALLGAFFCLYIFMDNANATLDTVVKLTSLVVCSVTAFGIKNSKKFIIQTVCFLFLNALIAGITIMISLKSDVIYHNNMFFYFNINPVEVVLFSAMVYLLITIFSAVKEHISPQKTYQMDLIFDNYSIKNIPAFYDSGFKVRDIVSNKDVVILSYEKIKDKLPDALKKNLLSFFAEDYANVHIAFVPVFFNTLTGSSMLPAVKVRNLKIEGKEIENIIAAFVQSDLTENVTAIFGTGVKRQL